MNYQTCGTIDIKMEQEFWNNIIERTTQYVLFVAGSLFFFLITLVAT